MTLSKTSSSIRSALPENKMTGTKRSVSFKFDGPSKSLSTSQPLGDNGLQSLGTKRRYMRRGSKSPSMLMMSFEQKQKLLEDYNCETSVSESVVAHHKQRRMSLMSALRVNMERSMILEPKVAESFRNMSPDQKRNLTFELLSRV